MAIEVYDAENLPTDIVTAQLVDLLQSKETEYGLTDAVVYHEFPIYRDTNGPVLAAKLLLISRNHGVILFNTFLGDNLDGLQRVEAEAEDVFTHLFSRLLKNKALKQSKRELKFEVQTAIYAPNAKGGVFEPEDTQLIVFEKQLSDFLKSADADPLSSDLLQEIVATIDGSKGLIRPKDRPVSNDDENELKMGFIINSLEAEISAFDKKQKESYLTEITGPQRIRGLAGSGKTVILALKAAHLHLKYPDKTILYTFYTKSLYQHVKQLISRFYRQFDDTEPNWDKLKIMHAWGGQSSPGVYYLTCKAHTIVPMTYPEAAGRGRDPFDVACSTLVENARIKPMYDYILLDEGQDYPTSFLKLCVQLAESEKIVVAYDDLQTIFRTKAPTTADIFGTNEDGSSVKNFDPDIVLHKCYRNPREILVCAHALGFGIYGPRIVQMLENAEHWSDIGYELIEGEVNAGEKVVFKRPAENSLKSVSEMSNLDQIISMQTYKDFSSELNGAVEKISSCLADGLRPDDILVISVDDRNAKTYLSELNRQLQGKGIPTHSIHGSFGTPDFQKPGHVTLSTIHKAKGNEAYYVIVLGVDALFPQPTGRSRNILFTALTRAKGWVHLSGSGPGAAACAAEIDAAKAKCPNLEFIYPSREDIGFMRRDLEAEASRKLRAEKMLDEVTQDMSPEEIEIYLAKQGKLTKKIPRPRKPSK